METTGSIDVTQSKPRLPIWLTGGAILLISMTVVNAGNYLFNLVLGRWLGPAAFADLSLIVTLMLMVTFITVTFQLTAAKISAAYHAEGDTVQLEAFRQWFGKLAWVIGGVAGAIVALGSPLWRDFFNSQSALPFVVLGVGLPVYFAQGVDRGILQGQTRFIRLSLTFVVEMVVRLGLGLALVALGWSVMGAVLAITASFFATWLVAREWASPSEVNELAVSQKAIVRAFAWPVVVVHISQILINNSDILIVKRFFEAEEAGQYAALALIGRVVFFATWSVVNTLFPVVAQKHAKGESYRKLLWAGLGLVCAMSAAITALTIFVPELIVNTLFGEAYLSIAPLLWLYAVATMLYALGNVVVNVRLSAENITGTWLATLFGIAQVVTLWFFHDSLRQVVILQIFLMGGLFICLMIWDFILARREGLST